MTNAMFRTVPLAAVLLFAAAAAHAQQSVTQPSANLNQSQTLTNQSQQPANVSGPGAVVRGQQMNQPSTNLNQTQSRQTQGQSTGGLGKPGVPTSGTGPSR